MRAVVLAAACLALPAACSRIPEVAAATDPAALKAPYPQLLPVGSIPTSEVPPTDDPAGASLAARAARLRATAGLPAR